MSIQLAFLIGVFAGLRSLTAPAVVAWAVHLGRLKLDGPLAHIGDTVSVAILTILAVAELIADKLPKTPNRTAAVGLCARFVTGGLTGACVMSAWGESAWLGALFGSTGAEAGAFGGYQARTWLVKKLGTRDFVIALAEDLVAVSGCLLVVMCY
jgi:uncharacterized membrane protein